MPKFIVTIEYKARPTFEVEAATQDEAEEMALDLADPSDFDPADLGVTVFESEEIEE